MGRGSLVWERRGRALATRPDRRKRGRREKGLSKYKDTRVTWEGDGH
jgi:hypothetical protein